MQHLTAEELLAELVHRSIEPENGQDDYTVTIGHMDAEVRLLIRLMPGAIMLQETCLSPAELKAAIKRANNAPSAGNEWFSKLHKILDKIRNNG